MTKVFINGQSGTTGLRLFDRLTNRRDIELVSVQPEKRRDPAEIRRVMEQADVMFLCLPDDAAREAVSMAGDLSLKIIDASTAHRTSPEWVYGFPELSSAHRDGISKSSRVAIPGCHASGFASIVYPLVAAGVLPADYPISCTSLTGYSGGGKSMIAEYEDSGRAAEYGAPRHYALTQSHKHLPEMQKVSGLAYPPAFNPVVADFYSGMLVTITLHARLLNQSVTLSSVSDIMENHYSGGGLVRVLKYSDSFMDSLAMSGRDDMEIYITGDDERIMLSSRFDNLGKGASGAALQCFNIMTGIPEKTGLVMGE